MKKISSILMMSLCMVMLLLFAVPMKTEAANVTNGTLGDNGGIQWTYDADTKTLMVTGEDTGRLGYFECPFTSICADVENIIVKNCKLYNCSDLFNGLDKVQSITFDNFDTSEATSMYKMFCGCSSLTTLDVSKFNTSQVTDMNGMFMGCKNLTTLDVSNIDTSKVRDMGRMFGQCGSLTALDVSKFNTSQVTDMNYMFYGCKGLTTLDVSGFNTSNVTNMSEMFWACSNLTALNVSGFDTSKVTDMNYMFCDCSSLTTLDVSKFNTSQVTDMYSMFSGCNSLSNIDVSGFDTTQVTDMGMMFDCCEALQSLGVSEFNTSNVTKMCWMFNDCGMLTALDVSNFNTSNVTDMSGMFSGCDGVTTLDVKRFDTSKVTAMDYMFSFCSNLASLDMSGFDMSNVISVGGMLNYCDALQTIKTPKAMAGGQTIELPAIYYASNGNKVEGITKDFCNDIVTKQSEAEEALYNFVERMYLVVLDRWPDAGGVDFWVNKLKTFESDGANIAQGFLLSDEFKEKECDDSYYIEILYSTFFDREADQGGLNHWSSQLQSGTSREFVLAGFVNSNEFFELCAEYGISRGYMNADGGTMNPGIFRFAERLYTKVLKRSGEKDGMEYWALEIANKKISPEHAAQSFFASDEYKKMNTSDEVYIRDLYATFMDREADAGGLAHWKQQMSNGKGREDVLRDFAFSPEFKGIMTNFGL